MCGGRIPSWADSDITLGAGWQGLPRCPLVPGLGIQEPPRILGGGALLPALPLGPEECSPVDRAPTSVSLITPRSCVCRSLIATISVLRWQHSFLKVST